MSAVVSMKENPKGSSLALQGTFTSSAPEKEETTITTRRPRPTSPMDSSLANSFSLSPDTKRIKATDSFRIWSPASEIISLPSKATLKVLLENALVDSKGDQSMLEAAGILSLEQVLLPAIALYEEAALKRVQAKIQRDHPQYKSTVEAGRRLIRVSIRNALVAAQASRRKRTENQIARREEALELAREERTERKLERARQRNEEIERQREEARQAREQRFRNLQRQYPRNKDLWKEIVVLTRSRTQLEKEELLWRQAEEQQQKCREKIQFQPILINTECDEGALSSAAGSSDDLVEPIMLRERTLAAVKDVVLASRRIQQGLGQVMTTLNESKKVREQLYKEYRDDHHFYGYQGVRNPKNLIRFLSQED